MLEPEPVSEVDGAFLVSPALPDELPVEPDPLDWDQAGCKLNPTLAERASAVRIVLFAFVIFSFRYFVHWLVLIQVFCSPELSDASQY